MKGELFHTRLKHCLFFPLIFIFIHPLMIKKIKSLQFTPKVLYAGPNLGYKVSVCGL